MKISVHPLFVVLGLYYAATGKILEFAVYTVTAVIHETGHSVVAGNLGYKLNKLVLMPFGAVARGDIDGLKLKDEVKIALAGPFVNVAVGLLFVAVWWIFPEAYAFTDTAASANFSMALVNFIPCYPLDGGRVFYATLAQKTDKKRAAKVCKAISLSIAIALFIGFAATLFDSPNISLFFFSVFALTGAFTSQKDNVYVKIGTGVTEKRLLRGMPVLKQAVSSGITVKKLAALLDCNAVNEIDVYEKDKKIATLYQKDLSDIIQRGEIYAKIKDFL